ncbi:hypothetical protein C0J52_20252 [Blattella germanica]|nr:hypothetical protein C0J52_20252 [Blattella germanica]
MIPKRVQGFLGQCRQWVPSCDLPGIARTAYILHDILIASFKIKFSEASVKFIYYCKYSL